MLRPPVDVLGEDLAVRDRVLLQLHRLAGLGPEERVGLVADRGLVGVGDAEQHPDHPHRHLGTEVRDEVEACRRRRAGRGTPAQNSRTLPSRAFIRFGVKTRDIRPRCIVCSGGSSNSTTPGGSSIPDWTISRMSPRELEKVCQSTRPFSTSA